MTDGSGRDVLVTGSSSGIGRAVTMKLLEAGSRVIAVTRDPARLEGIPDRDGRLHVIGLDLQDIADFPKVVATLPKLDGIVHSAGIVKMRPMAFFSLEQHRLVMDINLTAPLALTGELLRQRKLASGASIVFLSSINGNQVGVKGCASYAASKAGLTGAARVMALELAPQSIRVNCVLPGAVEGPMGDTLQHVTNESRDAERQSYPLGARFAQPEEVASAVCFLLSDQATFITGQTLTVDGGCSVQ